MTVSPSQQTVYQDIQKLLPLLACPWDKSELALEGNTLQCRKESHTFAVEQGVPILLDTRPGKAEERGTVLFEGTPVYFERLHQKRVNEWKVLPFKAEDIGGPGYMLDVGSGSGAWALANARRGMPSVGVEISKTGALFSARLAHELGIKDCFFVAGDATQLPFRSGVFHWVTNYTAIEHIYDPEKCIAEMARVLKSEGRVLVNTINNFSFHFGKGWETVGAFFEHLGSLLAQPFSSGKEEKNSHRDPSTVTYESWSSGEDVDLYEAVSFKMLDLCRRYLKVEEYYTFGYPRGGRELIFAADLSMAQRPLPLWKRFLYPVFLSFNHFPLLRHMGKTITVVGRPRR